MTGRRFLHTLRQSISSEAVEAAKDDAFSVASLIVGGVIGYKFTNWLRGKHVERMIQEAREAEQQERNLRNNGAMQYQAAEK